MILRSDDKENRLTPKTKSRGKKNYKDSLSQLVARVLDALKVQSSVLKDVFAFIVRTR